MGHSVHREGTAMHTWHDVWAERALTPWDMCHSCIVVQAAGTVVGTGSVVQSALVVIGTGQQAHGHQGQHAQVTPAFRAKQVFL